MDVTGTVVTVAGEEVGRALWQPVIKVASRIKEKHRSFVLKFMGIPICQFFSFSVLVLCAGGGFLYECQRCHNQEKDDGWNTSPAASVCCHAQHPPCTGKEQDNITNDHPPYMAEVDL